jgi:multiple sugar transport system substrate-binding protein
MKTLRLHFGSLILLTLLIAGCERQHAASDECHVPIPPSRTKVTVISYESHGMPFFAEQMTKCSQGSLVVRHQMLPYDELVNQATISMSAKSPSPYDIIHVYDQLLVEWAGKGWLASIDDLVQKYRRQYDLNAIPAKLWDMMKVNGRIYAIPGIQNPEIFFYRKDVFQKYGLRPPQTYDDLVSICRDLKSKGVGPYPLLMMYSKSSDHIAYEFHDLLHSMGGRWFNQDGSPAFNSDIGRQALEKIASLYHVCVHPDAVNFTPEDAIIGLQQGQFLMAVLWVNEAPQLDDPQLSKFAGHFGFAPAPAACESCPPAAYWAQDSWVIPSNASVDRELLFRIAMEGIKSKNQERAARMALVTRSAISQANQAPYWQAAIASIDRGAVGLDRQPYSYLAREAITRYAVEALLGHVAVKEGLDRAAGEYMHSMHEEGFLK